MDLSLDFLDTLTINLEVLSPLFFVHFLNLEVPLGFFASFSLKILFFTCDPALRMNCCSCFWRAIWHDRITFFLSTFFFIDSTCYTWHHLRPWSLFEGFQAIICHFCDICVVALGLLSFFIFCFWETDRKFTGWCRGFMTTQLSEWELCRRLIKNAFLRRAALCCA